MPRYTAITKKGEKTPQVGDPNHSPASGIPHNKTPSLEGGGGPSNREDS